MRHARCSRNPYLVARNILNGLIVLGALVLAPPLALAGQDDAPKKEPLDPFVGAAAQAVPIVVPSAPGVAPALALTYTSQGATGHFGVGWSLAGAPFIERTSAGRGAPKYDATDVFVLNGSATGELYPCQVGSTSPSCTTGGTHSLRIEDYRRIEYDSGLKSC